MNSEFLLPMFTLLGTLVGGLVTFGVNKQQFKHQIELLRQQYKTVFMAEETANHFLSHKTHIERSFEVLKKHLGGFEENELRKILVRAGAVRTYRDDGTEWWYLLKREQELIARKKH